MLVGEVLVRWSVTMGRNLNNCLADGFFPNCKRLVLGASVMITFFRNFRPFPAKNIIVF
jgi:hypothetical protein